MFFEKLPVNASLSNRFYVNDQDSDIRDKSIGVLVHGVKTDLVTFGSYPKIIRNENCVIDLDLGTSNVVDFEEITNGCAVSKVNLNLRNSSFSENNNENNLTYYYHFYQN